MDRLRSQALRAGGVILSHLGNHEWMNAIGTTSSINLLFNLILEFTYRRLEVDDLFSHNNKKINFVKIRISLRTQNI